jgi:hypothetical protein
MHVKKLWNKKTKKKTSKLQVTCVDVALTCQQDDRQALHDEAAMN